MDTAYDISTVACEVCARSGRIARCGKLFASMARIGLIGFGGGNTLVPVIEREVVRGDGLITKEEFDREVVVANITSGALPVEVASGVGRKVAGIPGMIVGAVGMGLPGALLALVSISLFSSASATAINQMHMASVGVSMLIAYVLISYAVGEIRERRAATRSRAVSTALLAASFLMTCGGKIAKIAGELGLGSITLPRVSTLDVLGAFFFAVLFTRGKAEGRKGHLRMAAALAVAGAYLASRAFSASLGALPSHVLRAAMVALAAWGLAASAHESGALERSDSGSLKKLPHEALAWLAFIAACIIPVLIVCPQAFEFTARSALSVLMSFGGGDAYLAFGQGMFVDSGMVSNAAYYGQVVTVSNAMPGSIICKVLVGVGYLVGETWGSAAALLTAVAGFGIGVGISGLAFLFAYYAYDRLEQIPAFGAIRRYIRPVIGGILLTIAVTMVSLNVEAAKQLSCGVPAVLAVSVAILALVGWAARAHEASLGKLILIAVGVALVAMNGLALIA
ncbi:MAG: chromate transporter [Coriobacteriaceae bacterium]|nr:MAG: chromate transporter [Coriobacteriaceae bacterium]RRF98657.1 MAG: chromate transporter [Coriobacteriaceae bacterium]